MCGGAHAFGHELGAAVDQAAVELDQLCPGIELGACLRAFEVAAFSMMTDGKHLVSFDDAVEVMYKTGNDMKTAYRETARGGLASLWRKRVAHG